jgi:hypothetical protein
MGPYLQAWLQSFAFTQLVEVPVYMQFLPGGRWRAAVIGFGATALTHPLVWFVFPVVVRGNWLRMTTWSELFAFGAEAIYMCIWLSPKKAFAASLFANGASLGLGLISRHLFGAP